MLPRRRANKSQPVTLRHFPTGRVVSVLWKRGPQGVNGARCGLRHDRVGWCRKVKNVARSRQACICIGWKQLSYSIYLVIASDLSTQCLSRQQQADGPLKTGNHILTDITVGISRPQ
jgi:hypothetical protein